jgi:hypothetical protein
MTIVTFNIMICNALSKRLYRGQEQPCRCLCDGLCEILGNASASASQVLVRAQKHMGILQKPDSQ